MGNFMNNSEKRKIELETRVLSSKGKSLFDRELMELILYRNVESGTVSERLIDLFKSVGKVISADLHELKSITGMNDSAVATIFCIREVIEKMLREDLKELPVKVIY